MRPGRRGGPSLLLSIFLFLALTREGAVRVQDDAKSGGGAAGAGGAGARGEAASVPGGEASAGAAEKRELLPEFFLRNTSRVAGKPRLESLTVDTSYGPLKIPLGELVSVRFATRLDPEREEKLRQALPRLASSEAAESEAAAALLREAGLDSLPVLRGGLRSEDETLRKAAEALYDEIRENAAAATGTDEELPAFDGVETEDEVVARRFTVRGSVREETFSIETRYGVIEAGRRDLLGIVFPHGGKGGAEVKVGAVNTAPNAWLRTKVTLNLGQRLSVRATGQLEQQNYGLVAGPEGTTQQGGGTFGGFPMLSLVGKIGKKGKPFLIGRDYRGKANAAGALYLGIVPFRRNYQANGAFEVKVTVLP